MGDAVTASCSGLPAPSSSSDVSEPLIRANTFISPRLQAWAALLGDSQG